MSRLRLLFVATACAVSVILIAIAEILIRQGIFGPEEIPIEIGSSVVGGASFLAVLLIAIRDPSNRKWVIASGIAALCVWLIVPSLLLAYNPSAPPASSLSFFFLGLMISLTGSTRFVAGAVAATVFVGIASRRSGKVAESRDDA